MPGILVQGALPLQRLKTPLQICFFLFLCNNPSGAVARGEDCPIFSAAARAGGGASSTGCVAGLLSVRALAILRLVVGGYVHGCVYVESGYARLHS